MRYAPAKKETIPRWWLEQDTTWNMSRWNYGCGLLSTLPTGLSVGSTVAGTRPLLHPCSFIRHPEQDFVRLECFMHFQHVLTACGVFPRQMQTACHIISSCSLVSYPFPCYFPWLRNFRFALLAKNCLNSLLFNNLRCSTNLVKLYKNNCFTTKVEIYAYYPFLIRCESFGAALMRSISSATICLTSLLMR